MKPMQLQYTKITKDSYKFFYEDGTAYGEFYMDILPDGTATLHMKDPEYGKSLMDGLYQALVKEE